MNHFPFLAKTHSGVRPTVCRQHNSFRSQPSRGLKVTPCYMGKLYTSSTDPSLSSPWWVLGSFFNPTLLCAEAKAQFPASKGPLFNSLSQSAYPELEPLAFESSTAEGLAEEGFASRAVVLNSFPKPWAESISVAKKRSSQEGGWRVLLQELQKQLQINSFNCYQQTENFLFSHI